VASLGGVPVRVPFFGTEGDVHARLSRFVTPRTVALYLNTPNNPTGLVVNPGEAQDLVAMARRHNLWIWSDEVYAGLQYDGEVVDMRSLAPERTFAVHSFSKRYGISGARCGFVLSPDVSGVQVNLHRAMVHSTYSVHTGAQVSALRLLDVGPAWFEYALSLYRKAAMDSADALGVPRPAGSTFLFIDVGDLLDERGLDGFLLDCLDRNLILSPGPSFGAPTHVRLCYTCSPPDVVARGVAQLKQVMENRGG